MKLSKTSCQLVIDMEIDNKIKLRKLFDIAAAMCIACPSPPDAEDEMHRFAEKALEEGVDRAFIISLFAETLAGTSKFQHEPVELFRYFAYYSKWTELRELIEHYKSDDVLRRGAGRSNVWDKMLEAFAKEWPGAPYFESLKDR